MQMKYHCIPLNMLTEFVLNINQFVSYDRIVCMENSFLYLVECAIAQIKFNEYRYLENV